METLLSSLLSILFFGALGGIIRTLIMMQRHGRRDFDYKWHFGLNIAIGISSALLMWFANEAFESPIGEAFTLTLAGIGGSLVVTSLLSVHGAINESKSNIERLIEERDSIDEQRRQLANQHFELIEVAEELSQYFQHLERRIHELEKER